MVGGWNERRRVSKWRKKRTGRSRRYNIPGLTCATSAMHPLLLKPPLPDEKSLRSKDQSYLWRFHEDRSHRISRAFGLDVAGGDCAGEGKPGCAGAAAATPGGDVQLYV